MCTSTIRTDPVLNAMPDFSEITGVSIDRLRCVPTMASYRWAPAGLRLQVRTAAGPHRSVDRSPDHPSLEWDFDSQ